MAHHEFSPTTYYNTMGSHPPAFHVEAGDSIATTTVDARGFDHENMERAGRPNPQTGPFYVNGAEAGDMLVLKLHEVTPNRRLGWTTARLAPNVVDFEYEANFDDEVDLATWDVDVEAGTVALVEPQNRLTGKPLPFADCNPVAPEVAVEMSETIEAAGGRYIDGGIIGSPPGRGGPPRFYASGPHEAIMGQLDGRGISVPLMGGEVGRASAIKMCYASLSKGAAALNASALISAMNLGIYDEFIAEMESSQQGVLSNMQGVKSLGAKAFRWIDEMEQISATFGAAGATPYMHKGAADIFRLVNSSPIGHERPETVDTSRSLRETVELLVETDD